MISMDQDGLYHLRGQAAGPAGFYPLLDPDCAAKLLEIIIHFTGLYFCTVAALELMGSHYHLCLFFEAFRQLGQEQLRALAERFYPGAHKPYLTWGPAEWERFNRRLFNVSELMRNIQQAFARYYNDRYERKGPFWAGRFQSTESDSLSETVFYIELNAVRAHLAVLPEQWRYSSAWMRKNAQDGWLMPLDRLLDESDPALAEKLYWTRLYWRGTQPSKETDALIPVELAERMEQEKFARGCYLERRPAFSQALRIGTFEGILGQIDNRRDKRIYLRRRYPIPMGVGDLFALRAQRGPRLRI